MGTDKNDDKEERKPPPKPFTPTYGLGQSSEMEEQDEQAWLDDERSADRERGGDNGRL